MVMRGKNARLMIGMVGTSIPEQNCKFSDFNLFPFLRLFDFIGLRSNLLKHLSDLFGVCFVYIPFLNPYIAVGNITLVKILRFLRDPCRQVS